MLQALYEQYRPTQWRDVVGQDKTLKRIDVLHRRGLSGRAYWLSGQSGTGKTTIARLIAAEIDSRQPRTAGGARAGGCCWRVVSRLFVPCWGRPAKRPGRSGQDSAGPLTPIYNGDDGAV